MLKRTNCVMCLTKLSRETKKIPFFPIHMGTSNSDLIEDTFEDQVWSECSNCGCIQLCELIPLNLLYVNNHNDVVGSTWKRHHENFAEFILQGSVESVCEIGAAHGYLSNLILNQRAIPYTVIEPTENTYSANVRHVKGFVEENLPLIAQFDTIIHSHVLEHVYDPVEFIRAIVKNMSTGSNLFISFPNIERLIEVDGSNALNFEHTYYLHPLQLDSILKSFNLELIQIKKFEQHSFFYWLKKSESILDCKVGEIDIPSIAKISDKWYQYWKNLEVFTLYVNNVLQANSIPTFLFGAHIFSQTLTVLGLKQDRIIGVLDNSLSKQGQRLYGTHWKVFTPEIISDMDIVQVILKASHYQEEIKTQLTQLNPKVIILE